MTAREQRPGYALGYALFALVIGGLMCSVYLLSVYGEDSRPGMLAAGVEFLVLGVLIMLANPLSHTSFFFRFWLALVPFMGRLWRDKPHTLYVLGGAFALAGCVVLLKALA